MRPRPQWGQGWRKGGCSLSQKSGARLIRSPNIFSFEKSSVNPHELLEAWEHLLLP